MATVFDVAAYIIDKMGPVSHMKLQKLVYYSQAWSLAWEDEPLFAEKVAAWANGPVIQELFTCLVGKFKVTAEDLAGLGAAANLTDAQRETIDGVLNFYGPKSPQWLSDLTHMESPWAEARVGLADGERGDKEISLASLIDYYGSL